MLTTFKLMLFIIIAISFIFIMGNKDKDDITAYVGLCLAGIVSMTMLFMFAW